jgi:hypothetical protein
LNYVLLNELDGFGKISMNTSIIFINIRVGLGRDIMDGFLLGELRGISRKRVMFLLFALMYILLTIHLVYSLAKAYNLEKVEVPILPYSLIIIIVHR